MVIKISDNDNFSSKHHTEELTIDERQEFITTIKNLTQSLSNLEVLNRTIQEQVKAYQEQVKDYQEQAKDYQEQNKNLTDQVLKISEQLQSVLEKLEHAESKNKENTDLIKRLKVMCRNGQLDNDELKRLLFQGGQEKLKDKEAVPKKLSAGKTEKEDDASDKAPVKRNRKTNKERLVDNHKQKQRYLDAHGNILSEDKELADKWIPATITQDGKEYKFTGWQVSCHKVEKEIAVYDVTSYIPHYVPVDDTQDKSPLTVINPEEDFLSKTLFGFAMMADAIAERHEKRIPMRRIAESISQNICQLTRQQLAKYIIYAADYIAPFYQTLTEEVMSSRVLHLDETFMSTQEEENSRQYMLVFTSEKGVFYHYTNSRSQTVPYNLLKEHFGDVPEWVDKDGNIIIISTDGWYNVEWMKDETTGEYKAVLVGCMVHLRRYFYAIYGAHKNHINEDSEEYQVCKRVVELIGQLFHLDKQCITIEEKTKLRQGKEVRKILDEIKLTVDKYTEIFDKTEDIKSEYTAKFIKAINYANNQWPKFERIMDDGAIPLDNSEAERSIRDFAVLRHSTPSGIASIKGAKALAVFSSIYETCKKHQVPMKDYLEFLFRHAGLNKAVLDNPDTPDERKREILLAGMPWNYNKLN